MSFKTALKRPTIIINNIYGPIFSNYGEKRQTRSGDYLKDIYGEENVYVINNVNFRSRNIEERATQIKEILLEKFERENFEGKIDIIGYGFAGLDCRYLLTFDELFDVVETVVTVNSPNNGSFISDDYIKGKINLPDLKNTLGVIGIDYRDLGEVNTANMNDFNLYMQEYEETKGVFSINSMTNYGSLSSILDVTFDHYRNQTKALFGSAESDGIFLTHETEYHDKKTGESKNLVTFEGDIIEMLQLGNQLNTNQLEFLAQFVSNR